MAHPVAALSSSALDTENLPNDVVTRDATLLDPAVHADHSHHHRHHRQPRHAAVHRRYHSELASSAENSLMQQHQTVLDAVTTELKLPSSPIAQAVNSPNNQFTSPIQTLAEHSNDILMPPSPIQYRNNHNNSYNLATITTSRSLKSYHSAPVARSAYLVVQPARPELPQVHSDNNECKLNSASPDAAPSA